MHTNDGPWRSWRFLEARRGGARSAARTWVLPRSMVWQRVVGGAAAACVYQLIELTCASLFSRPLVPLADSDVQPAVMDLSIATFLPEVSGQSQDCVLQRATGNAGKQMVPRLQKARYRYHWHYLDGARSFSLGYRPEKSGSRALGITT